MSGERPRCNCADREEARFCPRCGGVIEPAPSAESEFRQWRRGALRRGRVLCALGVPAGLLFLPIAPLTTLVVSGFGALGVIVTSWKLARLPAG
ncbi:MAG: hypothetical protein AB1716_01320 [Planctomycetota bacterium]